MMCQLVIGREFFPLYKWSCFLRAATDEKATTNENIVMVIMCVVLVLLEREKEGERSLNKHMVYVSGHVLIDFTTNTIISMVLLP